LSKEENFDEAMANVFKCFQKPGLRDSVEILINDPKTSNPEERSPFWLLAAALSRFY